uniref:Uncharacterized protein n=1 Tax=Chromera velia CCMP2878 TaxID=1169474 RepID=A0A0G4H337_9ALVE|eukprot:Cvel_24516.t1-p1 / transcript=Cvel_24516.t1 / gene=Cvel_24516 / organism=Chromera_velia_CCMP2878 / gene_product=hypothetical protein / transcript_product=hypothetical protein / location=Cvel_scaffold2659:20508-20951(-) / protein_length=148 / sequence_SO=supercontig / SO=protein_coding / is_pseudo=false
MRGVGAFDLRLRGVKSEEGESRPASSFGVTGIGVTQAAAALATLGITGMKPGVVATWERPDQKKPKICMSLEQILRGVPRTYVELRDRMACIVAAYFFPRCQFAESSVILYIRRKWEESGVCEALADLPSAPGGLHQGYRAHESGWGD